MNASTLPNVAVAVLAAGQSSRAGSINKLLAPAGRVCMLARVLENVLLSSVSEILVVTGFDASLVEDTLRKDLTNVERIQLAHNKHYAQGLSTSLHCAIRTLSHADAVLVCLGDMPLVGPATINSLVTAFEKHTEYHAIVPLFESKRGNPVLISRAMFGEIDALRGDAGAGQLLRSGRFNVLEIAVNDSGVLKDFDTATDIDNLQLRSPT